MKRSKSQIVIVALTAMALVVAISGAGVYFGGLAAEKEAKRLRSQVLGSNLVNAIRGYNIEYRRYPVSMSGTPPEYTGMVDQALLGALTGTDSSANPRGVMFLGSSRIDGLTRTAGVWACEDAWGGEYEIHIWAPDPTQPHDYEVTAKSKGADGLFGTPDDIVAGL